MTALDFPVTTKHPSGMVLFSSTAPDVATLRGLLLVCYQHDAQPIGSPPLAAASDLSIRERLRGFILEAYVRQKPRERLVRHSVLTVFIMNGGSAKGAALQYAQADWTDRQRMAHVRTAQLWAEEFLDFALDKMTEIDEARARAALRHDRDYQAAALQCSQICGRSGDGQAKGSGGRGCPACPFHGL